MLSLSPPHDKLKRIGHSVRRLESRFATVVPAIWRLAKKRRGRRGAENAEETAVIVSASQRLQYFTNAAVRGPVASHLGPLFRHELALFCPSPPSCARTVVNPRIGVYPNQCKRVPYLWFNWSSWKVLSWNRRGSRSKQYQRE
jgi:hypothetical protein